MGPALALRSASRSTAMGYWHIRRYQHDGSRFRRRNAERRSAKQPGSEKLQTQDQSEQGQAFYDHFLRKKIRFRSPEEETGECVGALGPKHPRESLPSSLRANPLKVLEDSTTTLEIATKSLAAYISSLHRAQPNRRDARTALSADRPGTKALRWYQESQVFDRSDVLSRPAFFKLVAHALVGGNADHSMGRLLFSEHIPTAFSQRPENFWKGLVLNGLVCAHMYWSDSSQMFANGVSAWTKALAGPEDAEKRPTPYVGAMHGSKPLQRFAIRVHPKYLDPRSLERFRVGLAGFRTCDVLGGEDSFVSGYLKLVHPQALNPWPAFDFLESFDSGKYRGASAIEAFSLPGSKGAMLFYIFVIRLAQELNRAGFRQASHRSLDIGKAHFPDLFIMRFEHRRERPAEMKMFRRPPTAAESHRGVPLDKDGNVLDDELRREARQAVRAVK